MIHAEKLGLRLSLVGYPCVGMPTLKSPCGTGLDLAFHASVSLPCLKVWESCKFLFVCVCHEMPPSRLLYFPADPALSEHQISV